MSYAAFIGNLLFILYKVFEVGLFVYCEYAIGNCRSCTEVDALGFDLPEALLCLITH
ncbi:transmembrane protein, putative [Medicago truncatula]|uniref:Transmembrane protein, putative n=1 Tax=Medicago truncatula TaxID=3880 RepID=G7KYY0_MEDTR|nr:transmembrane protein, putative [Medicago truncatula]